MRWAAEQPDVTCFVLSISPENAASLALAQKLGFVRIGEQMDEVDGLEWIFQQVVAESVDRRRRTAVTRRKLGSTENKTQLRAASIIRLMSYWGA